MIHWYNILLPFTFKLMARLFNGLKYLYSVISVIEKRPAGNTEKWTLVSSWTARVRLVHSQFLGGRRVPGLCQITWWIVYWQKIRGHIWKKLYGNREIFVARTVGVWEHTDSWLGAQIGSVLKPIQTLKEYFWSHVYCVHLGTPWYQIVGAFRTVSNRESRTLGGWRVPGLGQITWWIVMTKKMRGHSGKKIAQKSRNSCQVNSRSCGCIGTVDSGPKCAHSQNQIQTIK